jgi:hypothetical protein
MPVAFPLVRRPSVGRRPLFCLVPVALAITACGGGSGTADTVAEPPAPPPAALSLTGTAATGAPINGAVVVIDATGKVGTAVATNAATGAFTVDVAGLTAPFLLQVVGTAGGKQVFLSAVATAAGQTVNLTPLTDLVVSAAAGVAGGGSLVDACAPSGSTAPAACVAALKEATTGSRLSTAVADVARLVKDLNSTGTDVLNGPFAANGTGFDALLDKILVTPARAGSPVATVTLIASNTRLGDVALPAASGGTATVTATAPSADALRAADAVATVLPQVQACLASLNALFPTSNFKAPTAAQVQPFIDDSFFLGGGADKAGVVAALSSGEDVFVAGFSLQAVGLAAAGLDPLGAAEVAALASLSPAAVLAARPGGGVAVTLGADGTPTQAWLPIAFNGSTSDSPWKFVKGPAYNGCAGGWRLAGPQRADLHMNARISRNTNNGTTSFSRHRAFHLNIEETDAWTSQLGTGLVDAVTVHGPGLAVYSGNAASPVGTAAVLTLSRPTGLNNVFAIGNGRTWYGNGEALQSCQDLAGSSAPAGTPCVDEAQVVPGALYAWVLKAGGMPVAAFPYQVMAVPMSRAFMQANQTQLFATITTVSPASVAAARTAIGNSSAAVLDSLFTVNYTQGSAYGSKADNCGLQLHDGTGNLLLNAEANAVGRETRCTFASDSLNSGSLARPANAAAITSGSIWVTTQVLGNQATSGQALP